MRLFAAVVLLALPVTAAAQQPSPPPRDESVVVTSGDGVVQAIPDRAFITVTAESRAGNPRDAQKKNADAMKPVQDRLRTAGIPDEAIRTTEYDLQPDWDYTGNQRVLRGYVARNTIEIRVDNVDRIGELLEMVVTAGATSVGGVRFDLKDRPRLEREALRLAVADARARAVAAAGGAGRSFDRIIRIEEQGVSSPPQPVLYRAALAAEQKSGEPQIASGQIEVRARVTLTSILK
jgi:uncharacterized protein YggE